MPTTFFPPGPPRAGGVLRRWAAPVSAAWASAVVAETTRPGDLVLDPFAQSDVAARAALRLGRSVAVTDFNPVQVLALRAALTPPPPQTVARALLKLSESVKVDRPLRDALRGLYQTRCPHCQAETIAEAFVWQAEPRRPLRKLLTCEACGWRGAAPADAEDEARATDLEPLSLAYWRLVEQLADSADPLRPLAERLVACYTPRAQRALADLLRHLNLLDLPPDEGEALRMVIAGALDVGSILNATLWDTAPPRRLDPPRRFVELNVWAAVERIAADLRDTPPEPDAEWVAAPDQIETTAALPFAFVGRLPARALGEALAGRARLALGAPPRMSSLFWTLSWAWAGWLWSRRAAAPLRPLVERGSVDWDWYGHALGAALGGVRAALTSGGAVALAWSADREALTAALVGATQAGLAAQSSVLHIARPGSRWLDGQLLLTPGAKPPRLAAAEFRRVSAALAAEAEASAQATLMARGEPLAAEMLSLVAMAAMAASGRLGEAVGLFEEASLGGEFAHAKAHDALSAAVAAGRLMRLEDGRLWAEGAATRPSLCDQTERAVLTRLAGEQAAVAANEAGEGVAALRLTDVYAVEAGHLAVDAQLAQACLETHARRVGDDAWVADPAIGLLRETVSDLLVLGEALGHSVQFPLAWAMDERLALAPAEVVWLAGSRPALRFVVQASALFEPLLAPAPSVPHTLVVSERVARLLRLKLARAPHVAARAADMGWSFLVAERLRRWMRQPQADAELWRETLGLDEPPAGDGQLRLFPRAAG